MSEDSTRSATWIIASALIACVVAIIWLGAPLVPAILGATAAGLLLYYRRRK